MEPLWGASFTSRSGTTYRFGRNDLRTLDAMGVNLLRLYDWEPRNYHKRFLDRCLTFGIKVLAPVSNYFLTPGLKVMKIGSNLIPQLLNSFSNGEQNNGTDYHPAIAGIIMGNEPFIPNPRPFGVEQMSQFTKDWVALAEASRPSRRSAIPKILASTTARILSRVALVDHTAGQSAPRKYEKPFVPGDPAPKSG